MSENMRHYVDQYHLDVGVLQKIYNFDQKMQFVDDQYGFEKLKAQQGIVRFFTNTGEIENKYQKDLNKFNSIEMSELFRYLNTVAQGTFANRKTNVCKYFEWSFSQGLIKLNDFEWLNDFSLEDIDVAGLGYKKYFKDFDDLQNGVKTIIGKINPIDNEQYSICYIPIFLSWFGLSVEEICNLQSENIDFENKLININNKTFTVNQYVLDIIQKSMQTDGYTTGFKTRDASRDFKYEHSKYIIRRLAGAEKPNYTKGTLDQRLSSFIGVTGELPESNRFYNHTFFLKDIRDSGAFYRILQYEKKNDISIEDLDKNVLLGLKYESKLSMSKENNFKQDYKKWENIFYGVSKPELDL